MIEISAWVCLVAAYLVFAGQTSLDEVAAGIACGGLAALWLAALRRASPRRLRFEAAGWTAAARAVAGFPLGWAKAGAVLLGALLGRPAGRSRIQPFTHGGRDDPWAAGRRALGVLTTSLAPDSYVLRTPGHRDEIEIHALTDAPPRQDPRWPT